MSCINCLVNYNGTNHRMELKPFSTTTFLTYDELKKHLEADSKFQNAHIFDEEKFVVEIFDKEFQEYVKLSKTATVPNFSKLRIRDKPKMCIKNIASNLIEPARKRPSAYVGIKMDEIKSKVPKHDENDKPHHTRLSPVKSHSHSERSSHSSRIHNSPSSSRSRKSEDPNNHNTTSKTENRSESKISKESSKKIVDNPEKSTSDEYSLRKKLESLKAKLKINNNSEAVSLVKVLQKYNDEFKDIMMVDDVWKTESVWPFIVREISPKYKEINNVRTCKKAFGSLLDLYVELLNHTYLSANDAQNLWPLFNLFHFNMDLTPFYRDIKLLKKKFDNSVKKSLSAHSSSANKGSSKSSRKHEVEGKDSLLMSSLTEVYRDDQRLMTAVEHHIKEFGNEYIPEFNIWKEITDQVHLYRPYDNSLVMKSKTRFFELLKDYLKLSKAKISEEEKHKWKLYGVFRDLDLRPFMDKLNK